MDASKIKNLIIILLLLVNVFFLGIVVSDGAGERAARREAVEQVVDILAANGIAVSEDADLSRRSLPVCTIYRDMELEKQRLSKLLGEPTLIDQGGGIIFFSGERGQAEFRGTGDFDMLLGADSFPKGRTPEATAKDFASQLGFRSELVNSGVSEDGSGSITLMCMVERTGVLNCKISCVFSGGSLIYASGTRPLDEVAADKTGAEALDLPTVLMRFLEIVGEGGYVCSELRAVELCYIQTASASGTGALTPVWRLVTDSGEFCLNGLTGRQETAT